MADLDFVGVMLKFRSWHNATVQPMEEKHWTIANVPNCQCLLLGYVYFRWSQMGIFVCGISSLTCGCTPNTVEQKTVILRVLYLNVWKPTTLKIWCVNQAYASLVNKQANIANKPCNCHITAINNNGIQSDGLIIN